MSQERLTERATQREHTTAKAESLNALVQKEFIEPGYSAQTIEKRPVFRELLDYLKHHPEIDYVIVYARSRAFRDFYDAAITGRMLEQLGVKLVSAREDFGDGIMARAMEGFTDIMNDVQNKLSGQDISVKMLHKAQNGGTVGRARLGYLNTRIEVDGRMVNSIGIDEERGPLVRHAFELYATGDYSIDRLYETMEDLGLRTRPSRRHPRSQPVSTSKLHQMLRDPYYAGFLPYKGEIYNGRHEPLVSLPLFNRVQDVLSARSGSGQRDRVLDHYLKGLLFCDRCHANGRLSRLIYTEVTGRNGTRYAYFLCRARQDGDCDLPHLNAYGVEVAIARHFGRLQIASEFVRMISAELQTVMDEEQVTVGLTHKRLQKQRQDLAAREERLLDLIETGELPRTKITERLNKLRLDRAAVDEQFRHTSQRLADGAEVLKRYLNLLIDPQRLYEQTIDEVRRLLAEAFYQRIFCDDHGVVSDELQQPVDDLHQYVKFIRQGPQAALQTAQTPGTGPSHQDTKKTPSGAARRLHVVTRTHRLDSVGDDFAAGSSKNVLVELRGFEPLASSLRTKRATNCATAPDSPPGFPATAKL